MQPTSLNMMFQLWESRGARLSVDRVNGFNREFQLVHAKRANLIENFSEVSSTPKKVTESDE